MQNSPLAKVTQEGECTLACLEVGCGLECHFVTGAAPLVASRVTTHGTLWQVPFLWTYSIMYLWEHLQPRESAHFYSFHTVGDSFPACIICGSLEDHSTAPRRKARPDRRQSLCFSLFRSAEGLLVTGQLDVLPPHLEYCRDLMSTGLSFCCCCVVVKSRLTLLSPYGL